MKFHNKKVVSLFIISFFYLFFAYKIIDLLNTQITAIQLIPPLVSGYNLNHEIFDFKKLNLIIFFSINFCCFLLLLFYSKKSISILSIFSLVFISKFYLENFNILNLDNQVHSSFFIWIKDPGVTENYTYAWINESWIHQLQINFVFSIVLVFICYMIIIVINKIIQDK